MNSRKALGRVAEASHRARLAQRLEKRAAIIVIKKDRRAPAAARHHVVARAGILNADAPVPWCATLSVQRMAVVRN